MLLSFTMAVNLPFIINMFTSQPHFKMSIIQTELAKGLGFGDLSKSEVLKTCLLGMAFVTFYMASV